MFQTGDHLDDYIILGELGRGGAGVVYAAEVPAGHFLPQGTKVAIKVLRQSGMREVDRKRFEREARYLHSFRHPRLVRILDLGEVDENPYLVMEHLSGETLEQRMLDERRLGLPNHERQQQQAALLAEICEGLHAAHLAGIVHRDMKPGNVMIGDDGHVTILDFGMAKRVVAPDQLTMTGTVLGTPAYMSPEQARGQRERVGPRSDGYAVGVIAYEWACGRLPFNADNTMAQLRAIIDRPLVDPILYHAGIHSDLKSIIIKALSKTPSHRYPNAEAMALDLRRFSRGQRPRYQQHSVIRAISQGWRHRSHIARWGLVIMLAIIILLATGQIIQRNYHQQLRAQKNLLTTAFNNRLHNDWVPYLTFDGPFQQADHALNVLEHSSVQSRLAYEVSKSIDEFTISFTTHAEASEQDLVWFFSHGVPSSRRVHLDGYQFRLRRIDDQWQIGLWRSNHSQSDMTTLVEQQRPYRDGQRWQLSQSEQTTTVMLNDKEIFSFTDLLPIEGPNQQQLSLAFDPNSHKISDLVIKRAELPELISSLTKAEMLRRAQLPQQAMVLYDAFIEDHPEHPDLGKAFLGRGLSLAMLKEYGEAIEQFDDIIANNTGDLQLAALFHAWQASVSDKNLDLAFRYFKSMSARSSFDRDSQIGVVPDYVLREIPSGYLNHARSIEKENPLEALTFYQQVLLVAPKVKKHKEETHAKHGLLRSYRLLNDLDGQLIALNNLVNDNRISKEDKSYYTLQKGWIHRLEQRFDLAQASYEEALSFGTSHRGLIAIWQGELELRQNQLDNALAIWQHAIDNQHFQGFRRIRASDVKKLLNQLVLGDIINTKSSGIYGDHVRYFNRINQPWIRTPWPDDFTVGLTTDRWPLGLATREIPDELPIDATEPFDDDEQEDTE